MNNRFDSSSLVPMRNRRHSLRLVHHTLYGACISVLLCLGAAAFVPSASADEPAWRWNPSGEFRLYVFQDAIDNHRAEDHQALDARLIWKNKFTDRDDRFFGTLNLDLRSETFFARDTDDEWTFALEEAYLGMRAKHFTVSVGRRIVTWGKMDEWTILDQINPQDLTWFVLPEKQERKIPVSMLHSTYFGEGWQVEGIYIPVFRPADLDYLGSDWAVFGRLKELVADGPYAASAKAAVDSIGIEEQDGLTDRTLRHGEFAVRFRGRVRDIDFDVYVMDIRSRLPALRETTSGGNTVKRFLYLPTAGNLEALTAAGLTAEDYRLQEAHPRMQVVGADWETVWAGLGLRGEVGAFFHSPFLRSDFSYVEKDLISMGLGVDHTTAGEWYWDVQLIEDLVWNYDALFIQEESTLTVTGKVSHAFRRGRIPVQLRGARNTANGDWMINPEVGYAVDRGPDFRLGAYIFGGDPSTVFGRYNTKDVIYLRMRYPF